MALYRTFVKLTDENKKFISGMQKAWVMAGQKKPNVSQVIRAVLEDYDEMRKRVGERSRLSEAEIH
jgi:tryptophanyl-tRNA synthetase